MNNRYPPLVLGIVLLALLIPTIDLTAQCAYECKTNASIQIPDSGRYILQPSELITADPEGCVPFERLFVEPATLTCASAGQTVDYEIRVEGTNFLLCSGTLSVAAAGEAQVYARDSVTFALGAEQNALTIDPNALVDSIVGGSCAGLDQLIVEPAVLDCNDVGRPVNYLLRWQGSDEVVGSGRMYLVDPTPPQITPLDTFTLFLPENAEAQRVRPELLVQSLQDNCLEYRDLAVVPEFVDCTDANRTQPFVLFDANRGDTLGRGVLQVLDTFSVALRCTDTLTIDLPNNGFPAFLSPETIILDFADNCIDPTNMYVTPSILDCGAVDTLSTYELRMADTDEVLCSGIIRLRDNSRPEITCVGDTVLSLPASGDSIRLAVNDLVTTFRDNCLDRQDLWVTPDLIFGCEDVGDTVTYTIWTPDSLALCGGQIILQDERTENLQCRSAILVDIPDSSAQRSIELADVLSNDSLSCATRQDLQLTPLRVDCGDAGQTLPYLLFSRSRQDTVCTGTITVRDTTLPEATCRDTLIVYQNGNGAPIRLSAEDVLLTFSDNCLTPADLQVTTPEIPCFVEDAEVDYAVRMPGGDTLCQGLLIVRDTFPEVVNCLDTLSVTLPADGSPVTLQAADAVLLYSDNCFDLNDLIMDPGLLDCTALGDTSLSFHVRIRTTNRAVCSGILEVIDPTPAQVVCQDTFRVSLTADGTAQPPVLNDLLIELIDNCATAESLTLQVADSFTCADQVAPQPYRILRRDGSAACSGIILVGDQTAPVITCRAGPVDLYLPANDDQLNLTPELFVSSFGDNCATVDALEIIPNQVSCDQAGDTLQYFIRWSFTGEVLCSGTFVARDTVQPEPVCRDVVTYNLPPVGESSTLGVEDVVLTLNDNCATFTDFRLAAIQPACADVGKTLGYDLIYRETGDTVCTGLVEVVDSLPRSIICKSQVEFVIPEGDVPPVIFPEAVIETFSDNCTRLTDLRLDPIRYDCSDIGAPMPYTLTVAATNDTVCTGQIIIRERTAPIVACKESITVNLSEMGDTRILQPGEVITSVQEDCTPIFDLTATITPARIDCDDAGLMLPYTVTVSDASGNRGRCNGTITVLDDLAPVALCKDSVTVTLSADGFEFPGARLLDAGSTDNCNATSQLNFRMSPALFNCGDIGQSFDTELRVRDRAGNMATCQSVVTVAGPPDTMSVEILSPTTLSCNGLSTFRANVSNGSFFLRYRWTILQGAERGWRILSSRSGQTVQVQTGDGEVTLAVRVENIGGCYATASVTETCGMGAGGLITSSLQQNSQDGVDLTLFPNPTDGLLHIQLADWSGPLRYRVFNLQGVPVLQTGDRYVDQRDDLDVSGIPAGTYLLTVEREGEAPISQRFIKQ